MTLQIAKVPSHDGSMSLYEALEHLENGTLPEVPKLSASESLRSLLEHADSPWSGWRLTEEAREALSAVLRDLESKGL